MSNVTPISAAVSGNCADGYNYGNPGEVCPPSPSWPSGLADTGAADILLFLVTAVVLILVGLVIVKVVRR